ncbi:MAG: MFS transporter [Deltaproteobacteria bacterium]|jgi:predicted MFS family arabinose efflux permease|nr:MFS transporter [Deltaproteobacteria bacterium]
MPNLREDLDAFIRNAQREWRFVLATFAASGVGYLGSSAAPVIVSALIESGLNHQQAGDLGTIELMTLALTTSLVMPYVPRVSHRRLAIVGALLAATGLLISALSVAYSTMIIGRLLTGIGSGIAISGANAAVAAREDAERIFAIIWTGGGAITAMLSVNLPKVVTGGNYAMGFGTLLVLCVVALPFIRWVPPRPASYGQESAEEGADEADAGSTLSVFGLQALLVIAGTFIYAVGEQAVWQFAYTIPVEAGIDEDLVGPILGFTTVMGLSGGAIAAWLGTRLGRIFPVVIGTLACLGGQWTFLSAANPWVLAGGGLFWGLGFYFVSPFQIGLAAAIDRRGRVAVATGGSMNFGYALGPTIAGRIIHHVNSEALVYVIVAMTLSSLFLLLPVAIRADRDERGD